MLIAISPEPIGRGIYIPRPIPIGRGIKNKTKQKKKKKKKKKKKNSKLTCLIRKIVATSFVSLNIAKKSEQSLRCSPEDALDTGLLSKYPAKTLIRLCG